MRYISWWIFWVPSILFIIIFASVKLSTTDEVEDGLIVSSLLTLSGLTLCAIIDNHYTSVIQYYAKGLKERQERRKEELEKKRKEEEAKQRHSQIVLNNSDNNLTPNAADASHHSFEDLKGRSNLGAFGSQNT